MKQLTDWTRAEVPEFLAAVFPAEYRDATDPRLWRLLLSRLEGLHGPNDPRVRRFYVLVRTPDEVPFDTARWAALPATEETEERFIREELEPDLGPLPRVVEREPTGQYLSDHYDYQAVRLKSLAVLGGADPRVRFLDGLMQYLAIRAWMN